MSREPLPADDDPIGDADVIDARRLLSQWRTARIGFAVVVVAALAATGLAEGERLLELRAQANARAALHGDLEGRIARQEPLPEGTTLHRGRFGDVYETATDVLLVVDGKVVSAVRPD